MLAERRKPRRPLPAPASPSRWRQTRPPLVSRRAHVTPARGTSPRPCLSSPSRHASFSSITTAHRRHDLPPCLLRTSHALLCRNAHSSLAQRGLPRPTPASARHLHASAVRLALSAAERQRIDDAVHGAPVVVFMKGTPELPMCGFSRAVVQILQVQGVRPEALK